MDHRGTDRDDVIDRAALGLTDWPTLWGLGGNGLITVGEGATVPGEGDDTVIGRLLGDVDGDGAAEVAVALAGAADLSRGDLVL